MGIIYCITHEETGKKYFGQTVFSLEKRLKEHINAANRSHKYKTKLHKYISKYGIESFRVETIEEVPDDLLNEREDYWINKFNTTDRNAGLNLRFGGSHGRWPDEVKQKISKTKTGINLTEEHKKKISESGRAIKRHQTEYQKQKAHEARSKFWKIKHPSGQIEEVFSLLRFCKEHKLSPSNLVYWPQSKGYSLLERE